MTTRRCTAPRWPKPLVLLALAPSAALALDQARLTSQWIERSWNTRNGMPSETVWEAHQGRDGYLWVATDIGLLRFDGVDFDLFNGDTEDAFRNNDVRSVAEASDGTLWLATYGGGVVQRRDGQFHRFDEAHGLVSPVVLSVRLDQDDVLWAGTASGVCRMPPGAEEFRCWTPADGVTKGRAGRIAVEETGEVWVGSIDGGLNLFRGLELTSFDTQDGLDSLQVFLTERDTKLGILIGTYSGGLYTASAQTGITPLDPAGIPPGSVVLSAARDHDDTLWFGINQGGLRSYPEGRALRTPTFDNLHPFGLSVDRDGGLWVATTRGLYQFREGDFVPWGVPEGLGESTFVLAEDPVSKAVWVGTEGKGLYRISATDDVTRFTTEQGLPANSVSALWREDDGALWVGTFGGGIAIMREGVVERIIDGTDGLASDQVAVIFRDRDDAIWIGTPAGLNKFSGDQITHTLTSEDGLPTNFVRQISQRPDGQLLLTTEQGLAFLDPASAQVVDVLDLQDGLDTAVIGVSYVDARGVAWIGKRDGGLARLEDGALFQYTAAHGITARSVMAIVEDLEGYLWLAGRAGISRVHRDDLDRVARGDLKRVERIRRFRERDGLRSAKVFGGFQPPMLRASDGRIWIATTRGAAVVQPALLTERGPPPAITVEAVRVDDQSIPLTNPVRIPAGARAIEIDYTAPSLNDAEELHFRYRLRDHADRWQNALDRRTAFFTSLPPRARTFEVQAAWSDGVAPFSGAAITPIALYVEPAWHQSRWFQALVLALLGALVYGGYRVALRGQRRRQRSLERLVNQRTSELRTALETVEQLSRRDPLTQVANRRHFEEKLDEEWARTVRYRLPLSLMMLDIDYFKQYNDAAGHLQGDECLKAVARSLAEHVRQHDFVARYGGEEFIVLFPDTTTEEARVVAERMRLGIRKLAVEHLGRTDGTQVVTASGGLATAEPGHVDDPSELIQRADEALYRAKSQGRDRVVCDLDANLVLSDQAPADERPLTGRTRVRQA